MLAGVGGFTGLLETRERLPEAAGFVGPAVPPPAAALSAAFVGPRLPGAGGFALSP